MNETYIIELTLRLERQAYLLGCAMGALASAHNHQDCPMSIRSELHIQIRGLHRDIDMSYFPEKVRQEVNNGDF